MEKYKLSTLIREIVMIAVTIVFILPFYILIVGALKSDSDVQGSSPLALPEAVDFKAFSDVLSATGQNSLVLGFVNSALLTIGSVILLVLFSSVGAYVIVRSTRAWAKGAFYLFLIGILLPTQLGLVPLYIGARAIGLTGTLPGLIVVYTGTLLPLCVFLYAGFYRSQPRDFEEAAALDGAGPVRAFRYAVLPLMGPVTATVAVLGGLAVWNDFFNALIFLGGSNYPTLPVVMYQYVGSLVSDWNRIFAVVIAALIPVMIFFLFAQKRLMQGFSGGLKA